MAKKRLNLAQSQQVVKWFFELLRAIGDNARWGFFERTEEELVALNTRYTLDTLIPTVVAPFKRPEVVTEVMTVITKYLSRANLHNPIGQWVADPAQGNKAAAAVALANDCGTEVGAIPALRGAASFIEEAVEWIQEKLSASCDVLLKQATFDKLEGDSDDMVNRVVAGEVTKDQAIRNANDLVDSLEEVVVALVTYLEMAPNEKVRTGLALMFGNNPLRRGVAEVDITDLLDEAQRQDPVVALRVNEDVDKRADFPSLQATYNRVMEIYANVRRIDDREADQKKLFKRHLRNLIREASEVAEGIWRPGSLDSISLVCDLLKQVEGLKTKYGNLQAMTDDDVKVGIVTFLDSRGVQDKDFDKIIKDGKALLLQRKDTLVALQKDEENRQKAIVNQTLRDQPRTELIDFESRRDAVRFVSGLKKMKQQFRELGLPDADDKVLTLAKKKLKIEKDKRAVKHMETLKELERYLKVSYITDINLLDDLLSDLRSWGPPTSSAASIQNIQEALAVLATIKRKKMGPKFMESDLEDILRNSLMRSDIREYRRAYAKEKVANRHNSSRHSSSKIDSDSDSDSDGSIDWNETIKTEVEDTNMDGRRRFLTKFLRIKLIQLQDTEKGDRNRKEASGENRDHKVKKVKFKDRAFWIEEIEDYQQEDDVSEDSIEELERFSDLSLFVGKGGGPKNNKKGQEEKGDKETKYKKKNCPLKCEKGVHTNGSLFFCPLFRAKSKDERRILQKKCHLCITCLSKVSDQHKCPIGNCKGCNSKHNILLCPKEVMGESIRMGHEDGSNTTSSSENEEDYANNDCDSAFRTTKASPGARATSTPSKPSSIEKSKESRDKKNAPSNKSSTTSVVDGERLETIKQFLSELVEKRKCHPPPQVPDISKAMLIEERVFFLKENVIVSDPEDDENEWKNNSNSECASDGEDRSSSEEGDVVGLPSTEEEDYEADSESEGSMGSLEPVEITSESEPDDGMCSLGISNDEASDVDQQSLDETNSPYERYKTEEPVEPDKGNKEENDGIFQSSSEEESDRLDTAPAWELNFLRDNYKMSDIFESEAEETDDSVEFSSLGENDSEGGEYDTQSFLMTSVANLRRRESLGIPTKFRFNHAKKKEDIESKSNPIEDTEERATLEETKAFLKEGLERDDRGIKQRNPRKSNFSKENWECNNRWEEIVNEGKISQNHCENIRLLQEPLMDPVGTQEEVTMGWTKTTLGPLTGGEIYEKLLQVAVEAYNLVSSNGRNMSSMLTPLTLLGDKDLVNLDLASQEEIPFKEVEQGIVLDIIGCADTGADTTVSEKKTRQLLGREVLPDATTLLQGCTGSSNNRLQDKMRFIDEQGNITVVEARGVETLGTTPPDSLHYVTSAKCEFGINDENEKLFEFTKSSVKPRVLISLRSGSLLCKQLGEKEMLEAGLEVPCFSPELLTWKTPLNKKLIVSGSIGVNPRLIEREHNYPRFSITHPSGLNETEIFELATMRGTKLLNKLKKINVSDAANVGLENSSTDNIELLGDQNECGESIQSTAYEALEAGLVSPPDEESDFPETLNFSEKHFSLESSLADNDRIIASNNGEVFIYSNNTEHEKSFFSRLDAEKLQKFIDFESRPVQPTRKCIAHRTRCEACVLVNKANHKHQSKLMINLWDNIQAESIGGGKFQICHTYSYRNDVDATYHPSKSNIIEAAGHSKRTIKRANDNGSLKLLEQQVEKMIQKGNFVELDDQEILGLGNQTHNFTLYNYVFNGHSSSTPYRMISNTSSVSSGTTISTEMISPDQSLNNMEGSLVRFRLHAVPLCGDIRSAYHCVRVDLKSSFLRLFFWWHDLPTCKRSRIFRQVTQSFGDTAASAGLEVAILKYVAASCKLEVDRFLTEFVRYADNIVYSFATLDEFLASKQDLDNAFSTFSLPLKYIISSCQHDPEALAHQDRGSDPVERLLGLNWNLLQDSVTALPDFNLHGTARGAKLGKDLIEMSDEEIAVVPITRLIIMRLAAQSYNRLQDILGPLTTSIKSLVSRSCELASTEEMSLDLESRDPSFCGVVRKFIMNLRKIDCIRPFRRAWVPLGYTLTGFVIPFDGGKVGYGANVYSIAADGKDGTLDRSLCSTRSRVSKRNTVAHEAQAAPLGVDTATTIMSPLTYDYGDQPLEVFFLSDSTCVLSLLNPLLDIRNTLLANAAYTFIDKMSDLSTRFPEATLSIGYLPGENNPADYVSKLFLDPIQVINSKLYRVGPEKFGRLDSLREDIVGKMKNGEFTYLGIPTRFLKFKEADGSGTERCLYCDHSAPLCGAVMTRAQAAKGKLSGGEVMKDVPAGAKLRSGRRWCVFLRRVKFHMTQLHGGNLLDEQTAIEGNKVLSLEEYRSGLRKFFTFPQLMRYLCWIVAIDRAKLGMLHTPALKLRREGFALLLRTSQAFFQAGVSRLADHELWGIKVMSLRLQFHHSEGLFGGNFMPVIGSEDPVCVKILRDSHQLPDWGGRGTHRSRKASYHKISSGGLGVTWLGKKRDVKKYVDTCGICNKQRTSTRSRPFMGPALARVMLNSSPFSHCSIDPLGYVKIKISKFKTKKVYPLILVDINTGAVAFELLDSMECREVYLALLRVQWRFATQVVQLFTDKGSQLSEHLLGEKVNFYQKKIGELWAVKNNSVGAQFRNYCERKVRCVKTSIRQALSGQPGVLPQVPNHSELMTVLELAAHAVNFVPYVDSGNQDLLSPGHILAPWQVRDITVQRLPKSRIDSLQLTRDMLCVIRERIFEVLTQEFAELARFQEGRLKLGRNRAVWEISPGAVVGLSHGGRPVQGVVVSTSRGTDALVRLRSGKVKEVALGTLQPISMAAPQDNTTGTFTHFISVELSEMKNHEGISMFQNMLSIVPDIGKAVEGEKLHFTIAVLRAPDEHDIREVLVRVQDAIKELVNMIDDGRFLISVAEIIFLESAEQTCIATEAKLGGSTLRLLRSLVWERLKHRITDKQFLPHLTLFRKCQLSPTDQRKVEASCRDTVLGTFTAEAVTVRIRKSENPPGGVLGWKFNLSEPKASPEVLRQIADTDRLIVVRA